VRRNATARGGGGRSHASGARGRRLVLCVLWRLCLALQMSLSFVHQLPAGGAGLRIRGNMWILLVSSGIPLLWQDTTAVLSRKAHMSRTGALASLVSRRACRALHKVVYEAPKPNGGAPAFGIIFLILEKTESGRSTQSSTCIVGKMSRTD